MADEPFEWDNRSYFPPLSEPKNMNAMIQCWGEASQPVGQMAVSEYGLDSSSASVFSDSSALPPFSLTSRSNTSTPIPQADIWRHQSLSRAAVHRLQDKQTPATALGKANSLLWVGLPRGVNTRGQRVCWVPAKLKKGKHRSTVLASSLEELAQYELRPETNQTWLQKGIPFKRLDLHRQEFGGPGALLTVFRDHHRMSRAPYNMNRPKPTRIGRVTIHQRT